MRRANPPRSTKTSSRILPASNVCQARAARIANPGERHEFALSAFEPHAGATSNIPISIFWCTGEDSNLRSSKERQIYSLLPLTTRPPVHIIRGLCGKPLRPLTYSASSSHSLFPERAEGTIAWTASPQHSGAELRQKLMRWLRDFAVESDRPPCSRLSCPGETGAGEGT